MNMRTEYPAAVMWKQYHDFRQQRLNAERDLDQLKENEAIALSQAMDAQERENEKKERGAK